MTECRAKDDLAAAAQDLLRLMLNSWEREDVAEFLRGLAASIEEEPSSDSTVRHSVLKH